MVDGGCEMGMVGLGVMGRNLALNMVDKGFSVAGYDVDGQKVDALDRESGGHGARGTRSAEELVSALQKPRAIMMMVPAGAPVDAAISGLLPYLEGGDILIDGGNSHFIETDGRSRTLGEKGILYLGVGISGGERGARLGPSIMPGGSEEGYARVRPMFEAIAASVDGEACAAYMGPGSAGHYVKMVHNGIEYGIMQLIAGLLLHPIFAGIVTKGQADLRRVVAAASGHAIPVAALASSLAYVDGYCSAWLPANLVQAQRDYFGSHMYRRIDRDGLFHTQWEG
jgi:6-phosphogluconate dehydrogenase